MALQRRESWGKRFMPTVAVRVVAILVACGTVFAGGAVSAHQPVADAEVVSRAAAMRVGAGTNAQKYNNWTPQWTYKCTDQGNFKVMKAKMVMWSNGGNRVKGFHFKYRVVPRGPGIAPQSNWSENETFSFDQGRVKSVWMVAGPQGQAWNPEADWALQIKLKYPRSLRKAYRFKYKSNIASPDCGVGFEA